MRAVFILVAILLISIVGAVTPLHRARQQRSLAYREIPHFTAEGKEVVAACLEKVNSKFAGKIHYELVEVNLIQEQFRNAPHYEVVLQVKETSLEQAGAASKVVTISASLQQDVTSKQFTLIDFHNHQRRF